MRKGGLEMAEVIHATKNDFDKLLADNAVVLVDFWATWCGPCRMVAPIMEQLAVKYAGRAVIAKVDVDEQNELAERFSVMSIPTVIVFKNGTAAAKSVGSRSFDNYCDMLDGALA